MMYLSSAALTLATAVTLAQTGVYNAPRAFQTTDVYKAGQILAFADGRCNAELDATHIAVNNVKCWYPVYKGNSVLFVKTSDLSIGTLVSAGPAGDRDGYTLPKDIWVMGHHQLDRTVSYRKSMSLYRISCSGTVAKFGLLKRIEYDAAGKIIRDQDFAKRPLKVAAPGSAEEAIVLASC